MALIKNVLAASALEASGSAKPEVIEYLSRLHEIREMPENSAQALDEFEKAFKGSSLKVDFYCVLVNIINNRPYMSLAGAFASLYVASSVVLWVLRKIHILGT